MANQELAHTPGVNPLVPVVGKISKIIEETPDVKTFYVVTEKGKPFTPNPGQLGMLSLVPVGEAMFSVTSQGPATWSLRLKRRAF